MKPGSVGTTPRRNVREIQIINRKVILLSNPNTLQSYGFFQTSAPFKQGQIN
jgi:hypothetical protein